LGLGSGSLNGNHLYNYDIFFSWLKNGLRLLFSSKEHEANMECRPILVSSQTKPFRHHEECPPLGDASYARIPNCQTKTHQQLFSCCYFCSCSYSCGCCSDRCTHVLSLSSSLLTFVSDVNNPRISLSNPETNARTLRARIIRS
jgi:hypothetical protein